MKKFEHVSIRMPSEKQINDMGRKGWEICGIAENPIFREFWFKRELSDIPDYTQLLISCAYMRNVPNLQHRTISEFNQFIEDVMSGKEEYKKYDFDFNSRDAIEKWIEKFHEYCKQLYKEYVNI